MTIIFILILSRRKVCDLQGFYGLPDLNFRELTGMCGSGANEYRTNGMISTVKIWFCRGFGGISENFLG
jgi:hypothetical protein